MLPLCRYCSRTCQAAHWPVHKDTCGWHKKTQAATQSVAGSTRRIHSGSSTIPAPGSTRRVSTVETEAIACSEAGTCRHTDTSSNSGSTARAPIPQSKDAVSVTPSASGASWCTVSSSRCSTPTLHTEEGEAISRVRQLSSSSGITLGLQDSVAPYRCTVM